MNIIKMFMNNVIIPLLAVRICEDSDNRGSDKQGCTVIALSSVSFFFFYTTRTPFMYWKILVLRTTFLGFIVV